MITETISSFFIRLLLAIVARKQRNQSVIITIEIVIDPVFFMINGTEKSVCFSDIGGYLTTFTIAFK